MAIHYTHSLAIVFGHQFSVRCVVIAIHINEVKPHTCNWFKDKTPPSLKKAHGWMHVGMWYQGQGVSYPHPPRINRCRPPSPVDVVLPCYHYCICSFHHLLVINLSSYRLRRIQYYVYEANRSAGAKKTSSIRWSLFFTRKEVKASILFGKWSFVHQNSATENWCARAILIQKEASCASYKIGLTQTSTKPSPVKKRTYRCYSFQEAKALALLHWSQGLAKLTQDISDLHTGKQLVYQYPQFQNRSKCF